MIARIFAILILLGVILPTVLFSQKNQIGISLNSPLFLDGNNLGYNSNPFKLEFPSKGIGITYHRELEKRLVADASIHVFFSDYPMLIPKTPGQFAGKIVYRSGLLLSYSGGRELIQHNIFRLSASGGLSFRYSWEQMITSTSPWETNVVLHKYFGPGVNVGLNFQCKIWKPISFSIDSKLHHFFSYWPKSWAASYFKARNTIHILNLSGGLMVRF